MNKKGFTFIELLIAVGIFSLSVPIVFGLFFINLNIQAKVFRMQEVKRQGDNALTVIQSVIRQSARSIHSAAAASDSNQVCTPDTNSYTGTLYFKDSLGDVFSFYQDGNTDQIASTSSKLATGGSDDANPLTSTKVKISDFVISCDQPSSFSPPLVNVKFTVSETNNSGRHEEQASMYYQTTVKLRN